MHGADVGLLQSLAGVDMIPQWEWGELELDDRQDMVWVWQDLPKNIHNEVCTHLTQEV